MYPLPVLTLKILIATGLLLIAGVLWVRKSSVVSLLKNTDERLLFVSGWTAFRLIPFLIIYVLFNIEPTSDVVFYWDEVSLAYNGELVYRDFFSPYSPLFVYFIAFWLKFWYHPKMIVLVMAIMEGVALILAGRFYSNILPREERLWRMLMYFVLPGALMFTIIGGQEDIWILLFAILACLYGKVKNKTVVYSLLLSLGILMTKAIFVLVIIPLFLTEKKKLHFAIPMAIVGLISFGGLYYLVGWEFLQPLDEAKILRAPNILSVINPIFYDNLFVGADFWNWAALLLTMYFGVYTLHKFRAYDFQISFSRFWVVLFGTMMIAQQSAYSGYLYLFLMPLVFHIMDWKNRRQVILLFVYNLLCILHPTLWWRSGLPKYYSIGDIFSSSASVFDYLIQVAIVGLTIYFIRLGFNGNLKDREIVLKTADA